MNKWLLALILPAFIGGCSVNPVTGKNELSIVSPQQEISIGEKNYRPSRQSQGGDYYLDQSLQTYIAGVGQRLAAVSDRPDLPYEFVVLNNDVPNAWALPGGKIAINRGLLLLLEDEAQLAAVLGHEIVHAAARHGASQMTRGNVVDIISGTDNGVTAWMLTSVISVVGTDAITFARLAKSGIDSILGTPNQIVVSISNNVATIGLSTDPVLPGMGSVTIPTGTTAQRPVTPTAGMLRFNTSL